MLLDLVTRMPDCCTCGGSSGVASCSLFCTCTCAMSGSVPGSKVSVVVDWPESSLRGGQVQQVVEPAHLLLDHLHDGVLDGRRRGAGIARR